MYFAKTFSLGAPKEYLVYLQELFLATVKDSIVCLLAKSIIFLRLPTLPWTI